MKYLIGESLEHCTRFHRDEQWLGLINVAFAGRTTSFRHQLKRNKQAARAPMMPATWLRVALAATLAAQISAGFGGSLTSGSYKEGTVHAANQ
ncbi:hypothetical protein PC116_g29474, partial [Phytophthora cactorum]